jgi:hypothetical protein
MMARAMQRREVSGRDEEQLGDVLEISGRPVGRRPVELTIVVEPEIRPWRYPPNFDFQCGEWLRREFESGDVEPWPTTTSPDLASLITMVLIGNRRLPRAVYLGEEEERWNDIEQQIRPDADHLANEMTHAAARAERA